jgi:hypothetical protein
MKNIAATLATAQTRLLTNARTKTGSWNRRRKFSRPVYTLFRVSARYE